MRQNNRRPIKGNWLIFGSMMLTAGLSIHAANADTFGFGTTPTAEEIAAIDIDVMADGRGLPAGSGTVAAGETVYAEQCAACHGENLEGVW